MKFNELYDILFESRFSDREYYDKDAAWKLTPDEYLGSVATSIAVGRLSIRTLNPSAVVVITAPAATNLSSGTSK